MSTKSPHSGPAQPYVLGTDRDELARLGMQHRLWADAAHNAWRRAGVQMGKRVLDVGCGPGYASFDLAQMVTPAGGVVGVDESAAFIDYLNGQAALREIPQLAGIVGDVQQLEALPALTPQRGTFDAAYARWVLCFVPHPERVVRGVASMLKPGGRFVVHDYFGYQTMALSLPSAAWRAAVDATADSWRSRGGDPDIVGRLPAMLHAAGLRVERLHLHHRVARGDEPMFTWIHEWWRIYSPKLVEMGRLTADQSRQLMADLGTVRTSSDHFAVCPPVYEVIAVKE